MINIAILASGSGSNAENIIRYFKNNSAINVVLILSNNSKAFVHERAKKLGIPSVSFNRIELYESGMVLRVLEEYQVDFIVLAGFMMLIPKEIIQKYNHKMMNIHPALLPLFGGKGMYGNHVHQAVKEAGINETGITIHYVNEHYDQGDIIFQAKCEVTPSDSVEDIAQKVHQLEYAHFPRVIEQTITSTLL